ncbi:helix-hairpin-helix domain-containing protein [bacterium]|nr:helix-hairpin-helix domain-containing protein [bacterium]
MIDPTNIIAQQTSASEDAVRNIRKLIEAGATIPFIARYRKENTGGLDEVGISLVHDKLKYYSDLEARKVTVKRRLEELELLDPGMSSRVDGISTQQELEDFYEQYRPERTSLAKRYLAKGIGPYADMAQKGIIPEFSRATGLKEIADEAEFKKGIIAVLAEKIFLDTAVRKYFRDQTFRYGFLIVSVKRGKKEAGYKYDRYFEFSRHVKKIYPHQIHAILRGEKEGILNLKLSLNEEFSQRYINRRLFPRETELTISASHKAFNDHLIKQFLTEAKEYLKQKADEFSIGVYRRNLSELLFTQPYGKVRTLAFDPGIRTGHKWVLLSNTGALAEFGKTDDRNALRVVERFQKQFSGLVIAVGNGTGSQELYRILAEADKKVFLISEDGASIYSASKEAREEFPDLDLIYRGSVSIGRRFQDPLNELVKVTPESLGVGEYQHDINKKLLSEKLSETVYFTVNKVGADLNFASEKLLSFISGISPRIASHIIKQREAEGSFKTRRDVMKVKGFGEKSFEQAEGFLRVFESDEIIDSTAIIKEQLPVLKKILEHFKISERSLPEGLAALEVNVLRDFLSPEEFDTGAFILDELKNAGMDPRVTGEYLAFIPAIKNEKELLPGKKINARIKNITSFGVFADSGAHSDVFIPGAAAYSEGRYQVGQIVDIKIISKNNKGITGEIL